MVKKFKVTVNGEIFDVEIEEITGGKKAVYENTTSSSEVKNVKTASVPTSDKSEIRTKESSEVKKEIATEGKKVVVAPLPGKVLSVNVKKGDTVKKGDLLLVIEAMKMENEIFASQDGTVTDVLVGAGDYVSTGDKLIVME